MGTCNFVGREKELDYFQKIDDKNGFNGIFLSGRKRSGKTAFLKEVSKRFNGKVFHFQFLKSVSWQLNIQAMIQVLNEQLPELAIKEKTTFKTILDSLFEYSIKNRMLVILDDFQNYLFGDFNANEVLQKKIEEYKHKAKLTLIISSSNSKKIHEMLIANPKLQKDITHKCALSALEYYDFSKLLPDHLSLKEKLKYYSVFGGTPYYARLLDFNLSFEENIKQKILSPFSFFETEINDSLGERIMRVDTALFLMSLIGRGEWQYSKLKEIFGETFHYSKMNNALYVLLELKMVEKNAPLNAETSKETYYEVKDNLLDFYSSLVFPNEGKRQAMSTDDFFDLVIKPSLYKDYLPRKMKMIAREFLKRKKAGAETGLCYFSGKEQASKELFVVSTKETDNFTLFKINHSDEKIDASFLEDYKEMFSKEKRKFRFGIVSLGEILRKDEYENQFDLKDLFSF